MSQEQQDQRVQEVAEALAPLVVEGIKIVKVIWESGEWEQMKLEGLVRNLIINFGRNVDKFDV